MIYKQTTAFLTSTFLALAQAGFSPLWAEPLPDTANAAATPGNSKAEATGAPASNPVVSTPASGASMKEPLIEVSVDSLEISENSEKDLGFRWNETLNFAEAAAIPGIFKIGEIARTTALAASLKLLMKNGQARILANPTLITKSEFEATFAVGGELPYPTVGQGGVGGVEFKKYGVILKILPKITPRKTIDAQINITVSNPDEANSKTIAGVLVPAIASRDAGSRVEVADGETVVMAGIKQSRREKTNYRVPFLGSIPLIGLLFRNTREVVIQNSLVIFVTFRLLKS